MKLQDDETFADGVPINNFMAISLSAFNSLKTLLGSSFMAVKTESGSKELNDLIADILAAFWPAPLHPFVKIGGRREPVDYHKNTMAAVRRKYC